MPRRPPDPKQRRALTTVRSSGRIERGGSTTDSDALARALRAPTDEPEVADSLTHPVHTYPARMDPATARALLELVCEPGRTVLDPFCGGGTVLVEARQLGARAIGVNINPLAVAIARAKVWTPPAARRRELLETARSISVAALAEGKAARRSGGGEQPHRGPRGKAGAERDRAIAPWFAPHVRRELEYLAGAVNGVRRRDEELADLLTVLLSSILYKVSKRTSDTDPRPTTRNVARGAAARLFRARAELLCAGLDELAAVRGPDAEARPGDARKLGDAGIARASVDAVVTSPPYAGTYDYADQHQLRLDFLGISDAALRAGEVGARRQFRGERSRALATWERDLSAAMTQNRARVAAGRARVRPVRRLVGRRLRGLRGRRHRGGAAGGSGDGRVGVPGARRLWRRRATRLRRAPQARARLPARACLARAQRSGYPSTRAVAFDRWISRTYASDALRPSSTSSSHNESCSGSPSKPCT